MIGEKIQKLRRDSNLTVRDLAEKADITPSMVSNFENNQKIPGRKVITKLAAVFGITEEELLIELETSDVIGGKSIGTDYIEKLRLAESLKSKEAVTLISHLIDFCVEKERKDKKFEAIKDFVK